MRVDQVLVSLGGLFGIGWLLWFFFAASRRASMSATSAGGIQVVTISVDGGYAPSVVELRVGVPTRLRFARKDSGTCTEEVQLPDFGIRRFLPSGAVTDIEFTPKEPGSFEFSCGMGMIRGRLHVR